MKKKKSIPRKRRELPYHATRLVSMWNKRQRTEYNEVDIGNNFSNGKSELLTSGGPDEAYFDEVVVDPRENIDNVWFSGDSMLIRLEAIDEVNFDSLLSTIRRLNKNWEITKLIGESFLKIYF